MPKKQILKICVDVLMTVALLLLMSYSLLGEAAHEWVGVGMFVLFALHHILNRRWCRNLFKGKYTPFRILQTLLVVLIFLCMLGSMASGVILSRTVFVGLPIRGISTIARTMHVICAYWGFVFLSLHLGLHWNMMMGMARKFTKKTSTFRTWILRIAALATTGYGVYAFIARDFGNWLFLRNHFFFFDSSESLTLFLLDHAAIMGLFVCAGHYLAKFLLSLKK